MNITRIVNGEPVDFILTENELAVAKEEYYKRQYAYTFTKGDKAVFSDREIQALIDRAYQLYRADEHTLFAHAMVTAHREMLNQKIPVLSEDGTITYPKAVSNKEEDMEDAREDERDDR